ncbi:hypothetical protein EON63_02175 [archaeon]|nr:MAG: hypothetical protein EON63_02175 [archaeon]
MFKRLIGSLYLSFVEKGTNPNWSAMDYNIPSHPLPPLREDSDEAILKRMISYDYVYPHLLAHAQERAGEYGYGYLCVYGVCAHIVALYCNSMHPTQPPPYSYPYPYPYPYPYSYPSRLAPHPPTGLTVDAIIIGSGCGGGVMAHTLTLQGYTVLVIEKGGYYNARDFAQWGEAEAMSRCLEKGGLCSTSDSNMLVLAGSCVGGGSTINWSASFETPEYVLKEWGDMGLQCFSDGTYHRSMEYIHGLMGVNTNNSYYDEKEECSGKPSYILLALNFILWTKRNTIHHASYAILYHTLYATTINFLSQTIDYIITHQYVYTSSHTTKLPSEREQPISLAGCSEERIHPREDPAQRQGLCGLRPLLLRVQAWEQAEHHHGIVGAAVA